MLKNMTLLQRIYIIYANLNMYYILMFSKKITSEINGKRAEKIHNTWQRLYLTAIRNSVLIHHNLW